MLFELCIFLGYAIGLAGKLISGSITYVVVVYILDLIIITCYFLISNNIWRKYNFSKCFLFSIVCELLSTS